jgi:hypothetical protein
VEEAAGHSQVDDPVETAGEMNEQILAAARDVFDAVAGELLAELGGRHELDEPRRVRGDGGARDGAADDARQEVTADGFDFREFRHGVQSRGS